MMIDVDDFKAVNDGLGHAAGDAALIETVAVIESFAPRPSVISRFGGEEFVVMCEANSRDNLFQIAEGIRLAVADQSSVTISIGAVYAPLRKSTDGKSNIDAVVDTLTRSADQAVYYAKTAVEIELSRWRPR